MDDEAIANFITMVSHKKLDTNDALNFLVAVKYKYQDNREVYDQFLKIMRDFKAHRANTDAVILRVKELFKGQHDLLVGFNMFLPEGYSITIPEDDQTPPKKSLHFDDAFNFISKVKTRLKDTHTYDSFLDLVKTYRKENKSFAEVYHEISIIFRDHQDLLEEFHSFLPGLK